MEAVEARMKELAFWIDFGLNRACNYAVENAAIAAEKAALEAQIKTLSEQKPTE